MLGKPQTIWDFTVSRLSQALWILLITNPLNFWAPVPLAHFPFPAKFNISRIWERIFVIIQYINRIWNGQQKEKYPIAWDFPNT